MVPNPQFLLSRCLVYVYHYSRATLALIMYVMIRNFDVILSLSSLLLPFISDLCQDLFLSNDSLTYIMKYDY